MILSKKFTSGRAGLALILAPALLIPATAPTGNPNNTSGPRSYKEGYSGESARFTTNVVTCGAPT
jgi:hypothetical protein